MISFLLDSIVADFGPPRLKLVYVIFIKILYLDLCRYIIESQKIHLLDYETFFMKHKNESSAFLKYGEEEN